MYCRCFGTFTGVAQRGERGIVEHIPMIERLYADLPPERRSKHVAYFLHRHFEHSDPRRDSRSCVTMFVGACPA